MYDFIFLNRLYGVFIFKLINLKVLLFIHSILNCVYCKSIVEELKNIYNNIKNFTHWLGVRIFCLMYCAQYIRQKIWILFN